MEEALESEKSARLELGKGLEKLQLENAHKDTQLASEKEAVLALETKLTEAENDVANLKSRVESFTSEKSSLEQALQAERQLLEEIKMKMSEEQVAATTKFSVIEDERNHLKDCVAQLKEELVEANQSLQACFTDEVSERASQLATQALRDELSVAQERLEEDKDAFLREQRARQAAEHEVERLKDDLAILLHLEGDAVRKD